MSATDPKSVVKSFFEHVSSGNIGAAFELVAEDVRWWVPEELDLRAMEAACDPLLGEHDFAAFCRKPAARRDGTVPGMTRRVEDAEWEAGDDGVLYFWIEANAFCHQMVRSIVGLLVEVGKGKRQVADVLQILRSKDRNGNAEPAPPHGLVLWEVGY